VGSGVNPADIVAVEDFSKSTLNEIVAHLERSTEFEHLVYREAELDALWSITGFYLGAERDPSRREQLESVRAAAHRAHDLVGARRPRDAAAVLRRLLQTL
jgi:hypothetical protein